MLFLEVTGSFDECLSVANEKGWERKLPLIRSFKGPFFYRMPLLLIFTEARNPRCSWGRCGAAGCLKTCLGSPCLCLGTLPHPCSWAGRCFLGHTSPDQQHPLLSEDSLADAVLLCSSPCLQSSVCSCVLCPHSAWLGMNPCLDLQHPLAGRLPSDFQLKTQFVRKGNELLFGLPFGPLASRVGRSF